MWGRAGAGLPEGTERTQGGLPVGRGEVRDKGGLVVTSRTGIGPGCSALPYPSAKLRHAGGHDRYRRGGPDRRSRRRSLVMMRPSDSLPEVLVCCDSVDFRKGIKGLSMLVEQALGQHPFSEHLFLFANRRQDKVKILYWERNGFCRAVEAPRRKPLPLAESDGARRGCFERTATEWAARRLRPAEMACTQPAEL